MIRLIPIKTIYEQLGLNRGGDYSCYWAEL